MKLTINNYLFLIMSILEDPSLSNQSLHDSLKDVFTCDYPELKLGKYTSDYLDFLDPKCMKHSIMQGKDCFGRPFISMKTIPRKVKEYNDKNYEACLTLTSLHKEYLKEGSYDMYLPKEIARHVESFLKLDNREIVYTIHKRYTNNDKYVIAESWRKSVSHDWGLLGLCNVIILSYNGKWCSKEDKEKIIGLLEGKHEKLLIN